LALKVSNGKQVLQKPNHGFNATTMPLIVGNEEVPRHCISVLYSPSTPTTDNGNTVFPSNENPTRQIWVEVKHILLCYDTLGGHIYLILIRLCKMEKSYYAAN